jgi:hypothetical protein
MSENAHQSSDVPSYVAGGSAGVVEAQYRVAEQLAEHFGSAEADMGR